MDEVWKSKAKKHIECYKAIRTLCNNGIIDYKTLVEIKKTLLNKIIGDFESEIEE